MANNDDKIVNLRQRRRRAQLDAAWATGIKESELVRAIVDLVAQKPPGVEHWDHENALNTLVWALVMYAAWEAKVNGLFIIKRLCKAMDIFSGTNQDLADEFLEWFGAGIPVEWMKYEDLQHYDESKPYKVEEED